MKTQTQYVRTIILAVLISWFGASIYAQEDTEYSPQNKAKWIQNTKESISVMSKILDHVLKEELGDDYKAQGFFSRGTQGYWIPDTGLVFKLSVSFPLQDTQTEDGETAADNRENDLWDQFENEISVDSKPAMPYSAISQTTGDRYNQKKVDVLKKTILNALAQYGYRFEGFRPDEKIVVIVDGTKPVEMFANTTGSTRQPAYAMPNAYSQKTFRYRQPDDLETLRMEKQQLELDKRKEQLRLEIAKSAYEAAQKQLDIQSTEVERMKKMYEAGTVSSSELTNAQSKLIEETQKKNISENEIQAKEIDLQRIMIELTNLKKAEAKLNEQKEQEEKLSSMKDNNIDPSTSTENYTKRSYGNAVNLSQNTGMYYPTDLLRTSSTIAETLDYENKLVMQIAFKDIPANKGTGEDIENDVTWTLY